MPKLLNVDTEGDLFSVDLCHRWRDVHGRWDHRLLYIHRFRGLEEDPDRKNVMRTAPLSPFLLPAYL